LILLLLLLLILWCYLALSGALWRYLALFGAKKLLLFLMVKTRLHPVQKSARQEEEFTNQNLVSGAGLNTM